MALPDTLLRLASAQHGILTRWQLQARDVTSATISNELRRGRLLRVHREVYAVPFLTDARSDLAALVYSFGPHAAASHRTAAALHRLLSLVAGPPTVTVARGHRTNRAVARVVRACLPADELTVCDGIPATIPERALLDLASVETGRALEQAMAAAMRMNLVSDASLQRLLERYPRRHGSARLRRLLASPAEPAFTRSEAEERFLALLRRGRLPAPAVNAFFDGIELDFFWETERLVVEIDGAAYHSSQVAQERDRRRDASLAAAGMRVVRLTWNDLTRTTDATLVTVALALARSGTR